MKIIATGLLSETQKAKLRSFGDIFTYDSTALTNEADFSAAIADKDVYICGGFERATKTVISAAGSLKLIIFRGVDATSYIDIDAATSRKIAVCNAPGSNTQAVAEFTISLLLSAWKSVPYLNDSVRSGKWVDSTSSSLVGKRLGIIGMGKIGHKVSQIAHAGFGMHISYFSRSRKIDVEQEIGADYRSLTDLLGSADAISLHAPSTASSGRAHLLTKGELMQMKIGSILINSSRASLVEPAGLFDILSAGLPVRCAAFDSFYTEGDEANRPAERNLLRLPLDRFIVTPHVAWCTEETMQATFDVALECLKCLHSGVPFTNIVNLI